jgi:ribulose-5-phosphate 4-epimerase/fuculose-1-phosphate aldolase
MSVDYVRFIQVFEQQFAQAKQLLIKSQALSSNEAGNISLRIPGEERLVIASLSGEDSGVSAIVDFDLLASQGSLTDNLKEVAALHVAIYRERPQVNAVIHTHSPYLTAFAIAGRPLRAHATQLLGILDEDQEIPLTAWGPRYAAEPVISALRDHPHAPAALLANHGPFAWSERDVLAATRLLVNLEEAANLTFLAQQIGTPQPFPAGAAKRSRQGWSAA